MCSGPGADSPPASTINNWDAGIQNAHVGRGPQNSNNGPGTQYNNFFGPLDEERLKREREEHRKREDEERIKRDEEERRKREEEEKQRDQEACLQSLTFHSIDYRRQDISSAHPSTCDWLFSTPEFQEWSHRENVAVHNGVLWIKGKPGTGKSTMMKHVLKYCENSLGHYIITAHFFNARGDDFEKTPLGMMRSLMCQLIEEDSSVFDRLLPIFRRKKKRHGIKTFAWRVSELEDFLISEIQLCRKRPILVLVDALDECSESHIRQVVEFLEKLSMSATASDSGSRICFSSRYYPHVSMRLHLELVLESRREHRQDIATYIMDKLIRRDKAIEAELYQKASGIFMWVVLVITMLNKAYDRGRLEAMHKTLEEVPTDLEDMFDRLLNQNNPEEHETILVLQWVLFSKRPLKLEELYYAVLVGLSPSQLSSWDESKITRRDMQRRIIDSSKGLIETGRDDDRVQFIHESCKDFLIRNQRLQKLDPSLAESPVGLSHDRLRGYCMEYIMRWQGLGPTLPRLIDQRLRNSLSKSYPFVVYAASYLLYHANEMTKMSEKQSEFMWQLQTDRDVFERVRLLHSHFEEKAHHSRCSQTPSLVLLLASHGYDGLLKFLLQKGVALNSPEDKSCTISVEGAVFNRLKPTAVRLRTTPLQAAVINGFKSTAAMLIAGGADVNAVGAENSPTALQGAASLQWSVIVDQLLKKGADPNARRGSHGTALEAAILKGRVGITATLIAAGADVRAPRGPYGTLLEIAADRGYIQIISMLLQCGVDVNAQGTYNTALGSAIAQNHKDVVEILLQNGANANSSVIRRSPRMDSAERGTPLCAAVQSGYREIVALLLAHGADINFVGPQGTALYLAYGNNEMFRILVENGADPNILVPGGAQETQNYREYDLRIPARFDIDGVFENDIDEADSHRATMIREEAARILSERRV